MNDEDKRARAERYAAHMKGWRDGASIKAMDQNFMQHPTRPDLHEAYDIGYGMGRLARGTAGAWASTHYGFTPQIVRTQEGEPT